MVSVLSVTHNGIGLLADASIRPVLLATFAAVLLTLSRTRRADARHAVWTLVLCTMLLMPFATAWLPAVPIRVLDSVRTVLMPAEPPQTPLPEGGSRTMGLPLRPPAGRQTTVRFDWTVAAFALYIAGFCASAYRVFRAYSQVRTIVRNAAPVHPGAWESESISVPMTVGLTIPLILLPKSWREWDRETLAAVLAHESAHVDRLDWLVAFLAALNRCIFWFHPLAWWLQKKIAALAEDAADDHSILAIGNRQQYASVLIDIASALNNYGGRVTWESVAMARKTNVTKRVDSILDGTRPLSRGLSRFAWTVLLIAAVPLFYGTAAAQLQSKEEARESAAKAEYKGEVYLVGAANPQIAPEQAQEIEAKLQQNPDDQDARALLIGYYFANGKHEDRIRHILWFIENHPDANVLAGMSGSGLNGYTTSIPRNATGIGYVPGAYEKAEQLWTANESRYPDNVRVLTNEAAFFAQTDLNRAESLLAHARRISANPRMVEERFQSLYMNVLFAATDPRRHTATLLYDDPQFAEHVKSMLLRSPDQALVASFAKRLMESARGLERMGLDARERTDLSNQLAAHAQSLGDPGAPRQERRESAAPARSTATIRVGGMVQTAKLITKVDPQYPPLAKAARIQGTVRLNVAIDPDGRVRAIETMAGHPLLIDAARAAVEKWEYQPTFLNGNPVTVLTTVDVNFTLTPQQ